MTSPSLVRLLLFVPIPLSIHWTIEEVVMSLSLPLSSQMKDNVFTSYLSTCASFERRGAVGGDYRPGEKAPNEKVGAKIRKSPLILKEAASYYRRGRGTSSLFKIIIIGHLANVCT
jgi:hypothetical protein